MLISWSQPGAILDKSFEFVACQVHKTIDSEGSTIVIILLLLLNVTSEGGVPRGEVTFEEVGKKISGSFTTSSQLILSDLDKGIELVNVALELSELLRQGGEMFTKDASGGLSVNERFADDNLDQEEQQQGDLQCARRCAKFALCKKPGRDKEARMQVTICMFCWAALD